MVWAISLLKNTDIQYNIRYFIHAPKKNYKFNLNLSEKTICLCHCTVYTFLNHLLSNVTHVGEILCIYSVHGSAKKVRRKSSWSKSSYLLKSSVISNVYEIFDTDRLASCMKVKVCSLFTENVTKGKKM